MPSLKIVVEHGTVKINKEDIYKLIWSNLRDICLSDYTYFTFSVKYKKHRIRKCALSL